MAVLPTPGSPIRTGLFFVRRDSTWMTRRISSSRPMTGSSLPERASAVRSRPYLSSDWNISSGFSEVMRAEPRMSRSADSSASFVVPSSLAKATSTWSTERYSSPMSWRSSSAASKPARVSAERPGCVPPTVRGSWATFSLSAALIAMGSSPAATTSGRAMPSAWLSRANSRCAGVTYGLPAAAAWVVAAWKASRVFTVQRCGSRAISETSVSHRARGQESWTPARDRAGTGGGCVRAWLAPRPRAS